MGADPRDFVLVERPRPEVAVVTLNRPERMNSMAFDVMEPLRDLLRELSDDNSVRVVVLTGAGRGFCSGADQSGDRPQLDNLAGLTRIGVALRLMELLEEIITTLRSMHQPVIAAVNGAAIGGGLCLSLACDIRIAGESAYFRAAGINNGLTASELGLSALLPRAVGSSRAAEWMLTGRDIEAAEAASTGLVSRVVPDSQLLESCLETADAIIGWSRPGIELTKRTLIDAQSAGSVESHMHGEGLGQLLVRLLTQNFEEAVTARKEKRPAVFRD
ncbi:enoyl-CoA hydratase [Nocardioides sp. Kera G14]|uniref:enoyl-CoA hydratase n=1 Tax=Nocardioides sp. Kera G14 TaxID=2884264 RepID=UPI001D1276C4|nr:enoyl-CoA hydratase [Nocardioides sp. Kera G14]UDY22223.1 enoyl-CoA hydratase [Nocardioides sp. Kera G14]